MEKLLTREIVESLDLIVASHVHPSERQDINHIRITSYNDEDNYTEYNSNTKDFKYFAVDLAYIDTPASITFLTPYLSLGDPKLQKSNNSILGNSFLGRDKDISYFLNVEKQGEAQIDADTGEIYHGTNLSSRAQFLNPHIDFDSSKEFMLVRSPNGKVDFENILFQGKLSEPLVLGDWIVINEDNVMKAYEFNIMNRNSLQDELYEKYQTNLYERRFSIKETNHGLVLRFVEAGDKNNPPYLKLKNGYRSLRNGDRGKLAFYSIDLEQLKDFDPISFNPDKLKLTERKENIPKSTIELNYSLVYASPNELIKNKRWAFNDSVSSSGNYVERSRNGVTRHDNNHLL